MNLAPVLITVYDRFDCLEKSISYLLKNKEAKDTNLYVVSDYAYNSAHIPKIENIREYIRSISGFKSVEGIFWESNKGSFDSCRDAINYIFSKYDRVIVYEDDILVSNRFLEYMNNALEFYKDDERIISIASHTHYKPIVYHGYPYEIYLSKMYSPWGSGLWRDKYKKIDWELNGVEEFLKDKKQIKEFNSISNHMLPILLDMLQKGKKYGDVMVCYNMYKQNLYTLYPIKTLSVNIGHDGRGEHCGVDDKWQNQKLYNDFSPTMIKDLQTDKKIFKNQYKAFYDLRRDLLVPILEFVGLKNIAKKLWYKIKRR